MDRDFYPVVSSLGEGLLMQAHWLYKTETVPARSPYLRLCQQVADLIRKHVQLCRTLLQSFIQETPRRRIYFYTNYAQVQSSQKKLLKLMEKTGKVQSDRAHHNDIFEAFCTKLRLMYGVLSELFSFEKAQLIPLLQKQNNYYMEMMEEEAL